MSVFLREMRRGCLPREMGWDVWVGEIRRRPWGLEVKYNDWGKLTVITA